MCSYFSLPKLQGANLYIKNIIQKFGSYNYGETKAPITAQNISKHLQNMTSPGCTSAGTDEDVEVIFIGSTEGDQDGNQHDGMQKRIKLENIDTDDDGNDLVSMEGNVGDRQIKGPNDEDDATENLPLVSAVSTTTTTTQVATTLRTQQEMPSSSSPPRLRDYSSSRDFSGSENEIIFLKNKLEKQKDEHERDVSIMSKSFNEIIKEMRRQHESELLKIVEQTKKKQWCSHCWKEAKLYCCWQTSYCDELCQRNHWYVSSS